MDAKDKLKSELDLDGWSSLTSSTTSTTSKSILGGGMISDTVSTIGAGRRSSGIRSGDAFISGDTISSDKVLGDIPDTLPDMGTFTIGTDMASDLIIDGEKKVIGIMPFGDSSFGARLTHNDVLTLIDKCEEKLSEVLSQMLGATKDLTDGFISRDEYFKQLHEATILRISYKLAVNLLIERLKEIPEE